MVGPRRACVAQHRRPCTADPSGLPRGRRGLFLCPAQRGAGRDGAAAPTGRIERIRRVFGGSVRSGRRRPQPWRCGHIPVVARGTLVEPRDDRLRFARQCGRLEQRPVGRSQGSGGAQCTAVRRQRPSCREPQRVAARSAPAKRTRIRLFRSRSDRRLSHGGESCVGGRRRLAVRRTGDPRVRLSAFARCAGGAGSRAIGQRLPGSDLHRL